MMASRDKSPGPTPAKGSEPPPGEPMRMEQHLVDKSAMMVQSVKPVKQMSQHVCSFAIYSHDMSRQIETHHYCTRLNQDFLQCAVYDSDDSNGRLLGMSHIHSLRAGIQCVVEEALCMLASAVLPSLGRVGG